MNIKQILEKFKKELAITIKVPKNVVDVSEKYIGLLSNAEMGSDVSVTAEYESGIKLASITVDDETTDIYVPTSGINYSTSEQDTGVKWIDGKAIYQKTIEYGTLPDSTFKSVDHNISNMDMLIKYECIAKSTGGYLTTNNPADAFTAQIQTTINDTQITIWAGKNRSGFTAYITMYYTKSAS